jgi:hypothetical protein
LRAENHRTDYGFLDDQAVDFLINHPVENGWQPVVKSDNKYASLLH